MMLRKIPLGPFIDILQDLFDNGADFIDISGDVNDEGEAPRDSLKITVKPEYLSPDINNEEEEEDLIDLGMDFIIHNETGDDTTSSSPLSDDDIEDLI
jgi:hypothetical protein